MQAEGGSEKTSTGLTPEDRQWMIWQTVILGVLIVVGGWWLVSADRAQKRMVAEAERVAALHAAELAEVVSPPPVLRRGPQKTVGGEKMSSWIVSGAGVTEANGTYTPTTGGYVNGSWYLYFSNGENCWCIGTVLGEAAVNGHVAYTASGTSGTVATTGWGVHGAYSPDPSPAPTVAEDTGTTDVYKWDDAPFIPDMPLAPGKVILDGVEYVLFPLDSATSRPISHGFLLYDLNTQNWSTLVTAGALFGNDADSYNSAGTYDLGDGLHVWVSSGVWDEDVPKITFKQFAVIPGTSATLTDTDTLILPSFDVTNFVQVSAGVFRFVMIDGSDISLCSYTAGSGTYSVLVTYSTGTALPTSYTATDIVWLGSPHPQRTDQALFSRGGTLYWMRRCQTGDPVTSRRVAAYTVTDTTCTLLADLLTDGSDHDFATVPDDYQTQTWGTFTSATTWGDLGRDYDHDTRLVWTPGGDATEGTPVAVAGVTRRWYLDDPTVLMAGWSDDTWMNAAFVYRTPRIYFVEDGEVQVDGVVTELHITEPVVFPTQAGEVQVDGGLTELHIAVPALFRADGEVSVTGDGSLRGAVHFNEDGEVEIVGECVLIALVAPPAVVMGYSGAELEYKQPTTADRNAWEWKDARPVGYDVRANRAFGALLGGVKTRTMPEYDRNIDPLNRLSQYVGFWAWCSEDSTDPDLLTDASGVLGDGIMVNQYDDYDVVISWPKVSAVNQVYTDTTYRGENYTSADGLYEIVRGPQQRWFLQETDATPTLIAEGNSCLFPWQVTIWRDWTGGSSVIDPTLIATRGTLWSRWQENKLVLGANHNYDSPDPYVHVGIPALYDDYTFLWDVQPLENSMGLYQDGVLFQQTIGLGNTSWGNEGSYGATTIVRMMWDGAHSFLQLNMCDSRIVSHWYALHYFQLPGGDLLRRMRLVLSADRDGMTRCFCDGVECGTTAGPGGYEYQTTVYSGSLSSLFGGYRDSYMMAQAGHFRGNVYECGFLDGYAATARDVACNPMFAKPYGAAAALQYA
jgi:hypothetical protein